MANCVVLDADDWLPFRSTINLRGAFTCFSQVRPSIIGAEFVAAMPFN